MTLLQGGGSDGRDSGQGVGLTGRQILLQVEEEVELCVMRETLLFPSCLCGDPRLLIWATGLGRGLGSSKRSLERWGF